MKSLQLTGPDYTRELTSYNGRERVQLRKRRTKLRVDQFRIIAQVGQGGYGSVYLARKADTGEICALKKMKKGTLAKMDEVKHVLVERDILCNVKTDWLVKLLYAFQDVDHVYLAMVSSGYLLPLGCICVTGGRCNSDYEDVGTGARVELELIILYRNTSLEETSEPYSTTLVCSRKNMPSSTPPRCLLVSMSCIS
jgi:hypothetical protein